MDRRARPQRTVRGCRALFVAGSVALGGCFADPTEVVVVVDTDAQPLQDFEQVEFVFSQGIDSPGPSWNGNTMPVTLGVRPSHSGQTFDVLVRLDARNVPSHFDPNNPSSPQSPLPPFAVRKASEVHFVDGEMRTLFLPIRKACACLDASGMPSHVCANALEPECADLRNPPLGELDEDDLPRLPASK
jgi:hypothetical protein